MKIKIVSVGKLKDDGGFRDMDDFYRSRIKLFAGYDSVELKEKRSIQDETELIKKHIPSGFYRVALREDGKEFNSKIFAEFLRKRRDESKNMVFVIGGAYGLGDIGEDFSLRIAPWTLPHQLARIVLSEQIYRGFSILSGSKYHHE